MPTRNIDVAHLLGEARAAVAEASARSHPAQAWDCLQRKDGEGTVLESLPYTDEAIAEFQQARRYNPDDIGVVHHLAIAHHARAWDFELAGSPRAAGEWAAALEYWREVASSSEFWGALEDKLRVCDPAVDCEPLHLAQRGLLEHLLDVHIEFTRHYCEAGVPQRANSHLEIIRRAKIPPAIKKRLEARAFDAMTVSVPEARASAAYDSALRAVERYLDLFPGYLPGLRMCAEVSLSWISVLSWQHEWDSIALLHRRVYRRAELLSADPGVDAEPLARNALEELAYEFVQRGSDRAWPWLTSGEIAAGRITRDEAAACFELALAWGRLATRHVSAGSPFRDAVAVAILGHALLLREAAYEAFNSRTDPCRGRKAGIDLYRKAALELEEAAGMDVTEPQLAEQLGSAFRASREELSARETERSILDLRGGAW
jgi:tetratricopeptide (TPR) repeat protein